MGNISVNALISCFEKMYRQKWSYVSGGASEGSVDCSGAFTYAFRMLGGLAIDHGSNSIYRKFITEFSEKPVPGYAAFKVKAWTGDQSGNRWYGQEPGNVYHIGLVDETGKFILNARGADYGFCKDKINRSWTIFGKLKNVDYGGENKMSQTATVNTASGALNVRVTADKNSSIISKLPKGTDVEVLQENGDWTQIRCGSLVGWCASEYLEKSATAEETKSILITDSEGNTFSPAGDFTVKVVTG